MIGKYEIVTGVNVEDFIGLIDDYINLGWKLQGGVSVAMVTPSTKGKLPYNTYSQALFWSIGKSGRKPEYPST